MPTEQEEEWEVRIITRSGTRIRDVIPRSGTFYHSFNGIEQSIAQTIEKDKETLYEYTFPTPKNIMHKKNIEVIDCC